MLMLLAADRTHINKCMRIYDLRKIFKAPDESITEYVAELGRFSTHCKFDSYLEDELCDTLVCGLRNDNIRKKLIMEVKFMFEKRPWS